MFQFVTPDTASHEVVILNFQRHLMDRSGT